MRSIHKKTLKRFLSTLLALTMVLGMVPFTALALPAGETAGQVSNADLILDGGSMPLADWKVSACVLKSNVQARTASESQSTTVYAEFTLPTGLSDVGYQIQIGNGTFALTVSTDSGGVITAVTPASATDGGINFTIAADNTRLKVTAVGVSLGDGYGLKDVQINVLSGTSWYCSNMQVTVPRKADITSLTATPDEVTVGQDFTVTAESDINNGYIEFAYNGVSVTAPVMPRSGGGGYATHTFTAVADKDTVTAKQFGMSGGVVNTEATETITVSAAPVVYTVTFLPGATGVHALPSYTTYTGTYNITTDQPSRDGYTFTAWSDGTNYYKYDSVSSKWQSSTTIDGTYTDFTTGFSGTNVTLTAQWTKNTVAVIWPDALLAGVTAITTLADNDLVNTTTNEAEGSTVTFKVTVTDGYDGSAMVVTANGSPLYGTKGTGNTYTYTFTATAATTVAVATAPTSIPTYYNVKFVRQAADATAVNWPADFTVEKGTLTVAIPNQIPTRDGYTFVKWAVGSGEVLPGHNITIASPGVNDDLVLRAVWKQDEVDVTYPADVAGVTDVSKTATTEVTETVVKGSLQSFTVTLGAGYDPATLTVTANGVALAPVATGAAGQYQYSFVANANTTIAVSTPSLLQYTVTLPTGDNFNAVFTDPTNNVTSVTVEYGTGYSFKVSPVGNYTISEVYINGVAKGAGGTYSVDSVTGPQTISIVMEAVTFYTVTYVVDGVQLTTRQVQKGSAIPYDVKAPAKDGYTFDGWYIASDFTGTKNSLGNATTDCEVYGRYNPTTATITFNDNGGSGGPVTQTKTYGVALNLSSTAPTWTGHTFLGWGTAADATVAVYQPGDMYSTEGAATLYAVWEDNTYTVTLPNGTGYTVNSKQSTTVEWDKDFAFTITVDRAYAATKPTVKVNGNDVTADITGTTETSKEATWSYTIKNIKEDKVVSITVVMNQTYTVTLAYDTTDDNATYENKTFRTLEVEHGYKVTQPEAPSVPGYEFIGWMNSTKAAAYNFSTLVTAPTIIYAQMKPIVPKVTWTNEADDGWNIDVTNATLVGETELNVSPNTVKYGSDMTFTITVDEGWDASKMQVAANGAALSAVEIDTTTSAPAVVYKYLLSNITANTNITVVGVERKTVTITYNANARDDVSGMPVQQVVKYYLAGDYDKISTLKPVRTGYEFLGWNTDPAATTATHVAGANANFKTDTTLYAIWKAKEVTVGLTFSDILGATGEWEKDAVLKETFNLVATFNQPVIGDVTFKKTTIDGKEVTLGTVAINGGKSVALKDVEAGTFKNVTAPVEKYWVEFKANVDEGYSDATSAKVDLRLNSRALSWRFGTNNNKLIIHVGNTVGGTSVDSMTAGQTYTLELPDVVELNAVQYAGDIVAGTQYRVKWQYRETAKSDWVTIQEDGGDTYLVTSEFSGYAFRALVEPLNDPFTKAATYTNNVPTVGNLIDDAYAQYLVTQPTADTVRQETETGLEILGADNEVAGVKINGANDVFTADHLAQFEGQKVTLEATVKETSTGTPAVTTGYVNFYRYGTTEPLNTTPVEVGANGVATFEVTISDYSTASGQTALTNVDRFYAVYLVNDTYDTSASVTKSGTVYNQPGDEDSVWVKSTAIQTPIIDSALSGKRGSDDNATSTSYTENLTDLLAGVEHKFTLRETGAEATGLTSDWSVVALDGRTVADTNYDIQWNVKTGDNTETSTTVGGTFTTTDNKVGDEISVTLIAKNDMKVGATSKKAIIGTKQDVKVTVTASDKIDSTTDTDAYQLDEVTLTATVAAKETGATMPPTGTVTFYYSVDNGSTWTKVGETTDLAEVAGVMTASIKTTELPVDATTNKQQNVKITAIYSGDETFNKSGTIDTNSAITDTTSCTVTDETVTVYSSVVYVGTNENKATGTVTGGINISPNGALKANNADVTLTLSDIFTLDHGNATVNGVDLSKLTFGTDYTVQWWKLENANACKDSGTTDSYALTSEWELIVGETNYQYKIDTVPQNVAYRAEITVTGTPITKGSDTEVVQAVAGRRVYYSNVLVVGDGMLTVTTNITTSANKNFNEEGIVKGETVTIHTLVAGATGSAPVCKLEATVKSVTDPSKSFTITADGGSYTSNGYCALTWDTAAAAVTPGYYTLTVEATSNNGYESQTVTRTLIVRDNQYTLTVDEDSKVYNGKAQGIDWSLSGVDIENTLAQNSVVVYYYDANDKMVEPTQAGTYTYELYLPASAYWTELTHVTGEFTITPRPVNVVDLVAQAKVYDGTTDINELEVILNDSAVDASGVATGSTGIINGDSIYATGEMTIDSALAGPRTLSVSNVTLHGDDVKNYVVGSTSYTETINVQRSQVKGDIANSTFKYTGSNITVPADDIILIDQAGNVITSANYTVTYYYHNGDGVEKVTAMNKLGKYTVIARPEQDNYKGGAVETIYVVSGNGTDAAPTAPTSTLINISDTVELYGATTGIQASATNGATIMTVEYAVNGTFTTVADLSTLNAGRYLVKVTASTGDIAYGIYTIVKARPELTLTANNATYSSGQINGYGTLTGDNGAEVYYTWTGGTIKGVSYTAPTDAGNYVVTAHVGETKNYTAHEVSANFTIAKAKLTIDADELVRMQYESYPDMVATFKGLVGSVEAPDTSLRDVQIQPEFIFNEVNGGYTNAALDQVGADYPITVRNALSRNYEITYVGGKMVVNAQDANADLAIHGMIDNVSSTENVAYYGDVIQLYAYGNYGKAVTGAGDRHNTSCLINWSLSSSAPATIDSQDGLLTITGVGTFTVTLTRGTGTAAISKTLTITALKKEVKVNVPDEDVVYNATPQTYTVSNMKAYDEKFNDVTATITSGNINRENIGSQIVTGKVEDSVAYYQSETYGGLFTINDKEVTVTPGAQTTVYGTKETYDEDLYVVTGKAGSVDPITDVKVGSMADAYDNLDVYDGYEILVAGVENMNYNVKYVTDQIAPDAQVTAKPLTVSTGTLNNNVGMTSGSLNPNGKFPVNGAEVNASAALGAANVRMYGEPNWVMDYALATLISGDSLADLATLPAWLVKYDFNIAGAASVTYLNHSIAIDPSAYDTTVYTIPTAPQQIVTDATMMDLVNYDETSYALGTQNIYQRPVELKCNISEANKELPKSTSKTALDQILIQNITAGKLGGEGGLATLLKHTVANLDLKVTYQVYNGTWTTIGDFDNLAGYTKVQATISVGNPDYYAAPINVVFTVSPTRYIIEIVSFGQTSASVNLYEYNEETGEKTLTWFPDDSTLAVGSESTAMTCKIYNRVDSATKYADYAYETPVVDAKMRKGYTTGNYTISYSALVGSFRMFAIADGYIIIDNT